MEAGRADDGPLRASRAYPAADDREGDGLFQGGGSESMCGKGGDRDDAGDGGVYGVSEGFRNHFQRGNHLRPASNVSV